MKAITFCVTFFMYHRSSFDFLRLRIRILFLFFYRFACFLLFFSLDSVSLQHSVTYMNALHLRLICISTLSNGTNAKTMTNMHLRYAFSHKYGSRFQPYASFAHSNEHCTRYIYHANT